MNLSFWQSILSLIAVVIDLEPTAFTGMRLGIIVTEPQDMRVARKEYGERMSPCQVRSVE